MTAPLLVVAGRAAFRLMLWATGPVLLAVWGREQFAPFAAAMGVCTGLIIVVAAGPEKAALKLVPRALRTRGDLVGMLRTASGTVAVAPAAAAAPVSAAAPGSDAALVAAAAAYCAALGALMLTAALYRALDLPRRDPAAFGCLAAGTGALLAATSLVGVPPLAYLWAQIALTLAVMAPLWHGLRRVPAGLAGGAPRARLRRLLAGSVVLMGLPEVLTAAATSTVYLELTLTPHTAQATELYLVLQGWSLLVSTVYLLQRLVQPRLAVRLARDRSAGPAERAARLARAAAVLGALWLAAAGAVLASGATDPLRWSPPTLLIVLAALCVTRAPLYVMVTQAAFVLENSGAAGLRAATRGSALGVLAAVAVGAAVTPLVGAIGAIVALGAKELVTGLVLMREHH